MSSLEPTGIIVPPILLCPIDGCKWTYAPAPTLTYDAAPLDAVMGLPAGTLDRMAATRVMETAERELATHFRTHTLVEWLTTLTRLKRLAGEPVVMGLPS